MLCLLDNSPTHIHIGAYLAGHFLYTLEIIFTMYLEFTIKRLMDILRKCSTMPRGARGASTKTSPYSLGSAKLGSQVGTIDVDTDNMASGFKNRDDPEYLKFMEDEIFKARQEREDQSKLFNTLVSKMDSLDIRSTSSAGQGRGILRTI